MQERAGMQRAGSNCVLWTIKGRVTPKVWRTGVAMAVWLFTNPLTSPIHSLLICE